MLSPRPREHSGWTRENRIQPSEPIISQRLNNSGPSVTPQGVTPSTRRCISAATPRRNGCRVDPLRDLSPQLAALGVVRPAPEADDREIRQSELETLQTNRACSQSSRSP